MGNNDILPFKETGIYIIFYRLYLSDSKKIVNEFGIKNYGGLYEYKESIEVIVDNLILKME